MGVRVASRTPLSRRPGWAYFWAAVLLATAFGLVLAATQQAWHDDEIGWSLLFAAADVGCLAMYFWIVRCWLRWVDPKDDYTGIVTDVVCLCEQDEHLCQHQDP